jgi:arsenate reductase
MFNILVLCTGNSARSILGEVLFNHFGAGAVTAFSAGSDPAGKVNPFALRLLEQKGHDITDLRSKSWDEFSGTEAQKIDLVITVCGNAARETCPVWIGGPPTVHWGFPDPAAVKGADDQIMAAFSTVYEGLKENINAALSLDLSRLSPDILKRQLMAIHSI